MLGKLFERDLTVGNVWGHATPSAPWGLWPGDPGYGSGGGDALQLTTVMGCVRLISDQISTLPIDVYRMVDGGRVEVATPDWLIEPIVGLDFPSWCSQVVSSLLIDGNAYVLVGRNDSGRIVELRPIDPSVVTVKGGQYTINGRPTNDLLHIRGLMLPGSETGVNPIAYARMTVGLGLSALRFGRDFFDGDGNMPGVIELPAPASPEQKQDLALQWQRKRRKGGKGLPGILDAGATWKPTSVSNEDAQFLETRRYTAAEIAGQIFLVDPSDLGIAVEGTSLTYANLQDRNTRRVQVTLLPWIVRIEAALSALLASPRYMKFNVDGLLRGSLKTQMDIFEKGVRTGVLTPNETRQWMNLDPLPQGDEALWPPYRAFPVESDEPEQDAEPVRSTRSATPPSHVEVHNHTHVTRSDVTVEPAQVTVQGSTWSPQVDVHVPEQRMDAPNVVINVEPTPVEITNEIDVEPTPVEVRNQVDVRTPPAEVTVLKSDRKARFKVERDRQGRIDEVTEE